MISNIGPTKSEGTLFQGGIGLTAQALSDLVYDFEHWTRKIVTNTYQTLDQPH